MKNNRCFVWAFSLLAPLAVMAQDVTEFAVSQPGTLSELVPQADYTTLSDVKITGTVNARDFFFIRDNLTRISTVDMTEATIAACEVEGVAYEADAIPANAFSLPQESTGMARMTTFEAPLSTRVIGDNAFYLCNVLRETNIGSLQELQYIGSGAFSRCNRMRSFVLPASVVEVGDAAFAYDVTLSTFELASGSSLESLGGSVLRGCTQLRELDMTTASRLSSIGEYAFASCSNLSSVSLPSSVNNIGEGAFMYTAVATADWSHLSSLPAIEGSMFYGVTSLQQMKLPQSVQEIRASSFWGCTSLQEIAFSYNLALVGDWAFSGCTSLDSIFCPAQTLPLVGYAAFEGVDVGQVTMAVDATKLPMYEADIDWGEFHLVGIDVSGVASTKVSAAKVVRSMQSLSLTSPKEMAHVALYDFGGNLLSQVAVTGCDAVVALPVAGARYIVRIEYADGTFEVVKR